MNTSKNPWPNMINRNVSKLQRKLNKLLEQKPKTMEFTVMQLSKWKKFHGVYAISINQNSKIIYIGRSVRAKGKLWQRLSNHFGKTSLETFKLSGQAGKRKARNYFVRFIGIGHQTDSHIGRKNFEIFAISVLSPKFNKG